MRKVFMIVIVLIAIVAVAAFFLFRSNNNSLPAADNSGTFPGTSPAASPVLVAIPTSTTLAFGTNRGTVEVRNFYKDAISQDETTIVLRNTKDYRIVYDTAASSFWLLAVSQPTDVSRKLAEQAFLDMLQTTADRACYLNVSISLVDERTGLPGAAQHLDICSFYQK